MLKRALLVAALAISGVFVTSAPAQAACPLEPWIRGNSWYTETLHELGVC